ncbi:MAG: redoxin domain-containing protein [Aquificae bacterium]|nr:redoxin domain-containing protein [Aquificota bacterium]
MILIISVFFTFIDTSFSKQDFQFPESQYKHLAGKDFLDFRMIDESGKVVHLKDFVKKGKPVVVVFWAIGDQKGTYWFLPQFNKLYEKYKDKVIFLAVLLSRSTPEEVQEAKEFIPLKIPVYRAYSEAIEKYKIAKIDVPYIVLITPEGKIKRIVIRPESYTRYEEPSQPLTQKRQLEEIIAESIQKLDLYIRELIEGV